MCADAHCSSRSDVRSSNSSAGHWALLSVRTFGETQDYVSFLFVLRFVAMAGSLHRG